MNNSFHTFGKFLRYSRKNIGLTQEELASKLNTLGTHVSKWETDRAFPSDEYCDQLSRILNVSRDTIDSYKSTLNTSSVSEPSFNYQELDIESKTKWMNEKHSLLAKELSDWKKISVIKDSPEMKSRAINDIVRKIVEITETMK